MPFEEVTIGDCRLIRADCMEVLPTLGIVDAVVTDPPFFTPAVHYQSRVKHARSWGDMSILESWWGNVSALLAKNCPRGHVFVFCNGDSYPAFYKAMFPNWEKLKSMVWDKGHVGLGRIFRNQHELIIWARSEGHFVPGDGRLRADVLYATATQSDDREHPVEKPAELMEQLVSVSAGGVVDPFMGSGTTGEACIQAGRKFIGIEIEPRYFDIACRRIEDAYGKGTFFDDTKKREPELFSDTVTAPACP
jgi:site-specific DNA-methyltransferase (adenine-specific)